MPRPPRAADETLETVLARAGLAAGDRLPEPLSEPLNLSSVYRFRDLDQLDKVWEGHAPGHVYRRLGHANQETLEKVLARLEGAEKALACASGMSAIHASLMAHLGPGDFLVAQEGLYGGTQALITGELDRWGIKTVLAAEAGVKAVSEAVKRVRERGGTVGAVLVETVANPALAVADIPGLCSLAASEGFLLIVDNTFATPLGCRPLHFGPCLVVHSLTKFLNGHSDVLGGVVAGPDTLMEPVRKLAGSIGAAIAPMDAWLTLRGLRTFHLRFERQEYNAIRVATWLEGHPQVDKVCYPWLPSHPTYERAKIVLDSPGAMVSFSLKGGEEAVRSLLKRLRVIDFAPSLGETATSVTYPAYTSHRSLLPSEREAAGAGPGVLRLSVGVEAVVDIVADLDQAMAPGVDSGG